MKKNINYYFLSYFGGFGKVYISVNEQYKEKFQKFLDKNFFRLTTHDSRFPTHDFHSSLLTLHVFSGLEKLSGIPDKRNRK